MSPKHARSQPAPASGADTSTPYMNPDGSYNVRGRRVYFADLTGPTPEQSAGVSPLAETEDQKRQRRLGGGL